MSFTAFAADHATSIPWVLRLFAPHYYHATVARKTLDEQKTLTPADEGFQEIQEIFMGLLAQQNSAEKLRGVSVARFTRGTAMLGFSESRAREMIPLDVELSVGQKLQWDLTALDEQLATHRESVTFRYAFVAFIGGTVIETLAFLLELLRPRHRESHAST